MTAAASHPENSIVSQAGDDHEVGFQRRLRQEVEEIQQHQQQQQEQQQHPGEGEEGGTDTDIEIVENEIDATMRLSDEERRWAIQLKQAALQQKQEDEEGNDNDYEGVLPLVSDFEYAQWALVYQEDTKAALRSLELCLQFRQTYGIDNSVEQGMHYIQAMMEQQPGLLLHIDVNSETGEPVKVCDPGVLNPKAALAGRNWQDFIRGIYYVHLVCQPNLLSIRHGATLLLDFGDVDSSNMSVDVQYQLFSELASWYPLQIKAMMAFHTGFGATMRISLVKAVLPKRVSSKTQLGCEINNNNGEEEAYAQDGSTIDRLRHFYLIPTLQEAQHHTLLKAKSLLEDRIRNDRSFAL